MLQKFKKVKYFFFEFWKPQIINSLSKIVFYRFKTFKNINQCLFNMQYIYFIILSLSDPLVHFLWWNFFYSSILLIFLFLFQYFLFLCSKWIILCHFWQKSSQAQSENEFLQLKPEIGALNGDRWSLASKRTCHSMLLIHIKSTWDLLPAFSPTIFHSVS